MPLLAPAPPGRRLRGKRLCPSTRGCHWCLRRAYGTRSCRVLAVSGALRDELGMLLAEAPEPERDHLGVRRTDSLGHKAVEDLGLLVVDDHRDGLAQRSSPPLDRDATVETSADPERRVLQQTSARHEPAAERVVALVGQAKVAGGAVGELLSRLEPPHESRLADERPCERDEVARAGPEQALHRRPATQA